MNKFKYNHEEYSYSIIQYNAKGKLEALEVIDIDWSMKDNWNYLFPICKYDTKLSNICIHALKYFESIINAKNSRVKILLKEKL